MSNIFIVILMGVSFILTFLLVVYFELFEYSKNYFDKKLDWIDFKHILKNVNKKAVFKDWMSLDGKNRAYLEFLKEYKTLLEKNKLEEKFEVEIEGFTLIPNKEEQKFDEEINFELGVSYLESILIETHKNEYDGSIFLGLDIFKSLLKKTDSCTLTSREISVNKGIKIYAKS